MVKYIRVVWPARHFASEQCRPVSVDVTMEEVNVCMVYYSSMVIFWGLPSLLWCLRGPCPPHVVPTPVTSCIQCTSTVLHHLIFHFSQISLLSYICSNQYTKINGNNSVNDMWPRVSYVCHALCKISVAHCQTRLGFINNKKVCLQEGRWMRCSCIVGHSCKHT